MSGAPKPETGAPGSVVSDGQKSCVRGTFVRVADEYAGWDVFKKFTGKVGTLTWRHFSGMWYADFPGEDEYGFLCGPLLFQLQYSSEEEARESVLALEKIRKERERKNALESEKSKQLAQALEKRAKELSATTVKLFEQMAIIQAEMEKAEMDLNKMERAFADLTVHANALDAELGATRSELRTVQSEKAEVQSQLADSRANVERLEKRIRELISERDKLQAELSQTVTENVMLSKELHEAGERSRQLDFENAEFKEENAKLQEELAHCKAQLGQLEESFLKARQEGADYMAKWERANAELKELERSALAAGGMSKAERDSLLERQRQLLQELEEMRRLKDEEAKKLNDLLNDEELFMRLASSRHGSVSAGPTKSASKGAKISEEELMELYERAGRCTDAERELNDALRKIKDMEEEARQGRKVPGLLKEVEQLKETVQRQKEMAERYRSEQSRLNSELKTHLQTIKILTVERDELQLSLSKMTNERDILSKVVQDKQADIELLGHKLEVMTKEEASQHERADLLQSENDAYIKRTTELEDVLEARNQKIGDLEGTIDALRKEIDLKNGQMGQLQKHLQTARSKVKEVEERERNLQNEIDLKMRKAESRIEELQEQLRSLGTLRKEFQELQEKYNSDTEQAQAEIEELIRQVTSLTEEVANADMRAEMERKIVRLFFHRIEHRISVHPKKVLFKLWHLQTAATNYWNANDTKKAQEAAVRKANAEAQSLRSRLGAAHRLVEEMQRRDKSITTAELLLAPAPSRNFVESCETALGATTAGSRTRTFPSGQSLSMVESGPLQSLPRDHSKRDVGKDGASEQWGNDNQEHKQSVQQDGETIPDEDRPSSRESLEPNCTQCKKHSLMIESVNQRNLRLQRDKNNFEEQARSLGERNDDLTTQLNNLKKQMNIVGCLRLAEKFSSSINERKIALEARTICQSLTVALVDKDRSLRETGTVQANATTSSILSRKAELEAEALGRGSTLELELQARTNKYQDFMDIANKSDNIPKSIFEQLDTLTSQVGDLVSRHSGLHMRRKRKELDLIQAQNLPGSIERQGALLPPANTALPSRPQTAHK